MIICSEQPAVQASPALSTAGAEGCGPEVAPSAPGHTAGDGCRRPFTGQASRAVDSVTERPPGDGCCAAQETSDDRPGQPVHLSRAGPWALGSPGTAQELRLGCMGICGFQRVGPWFVRKLSGTPESLCWHARHGPSPEPRAPSSALRLRSLAANGA